MGKDNRPYKLRQPKNLKEYVLQHCARRYYLLFSTKTGRISCTGCGAEWNMGDTPWLGTHQTDEMNTTYCPECGRPAIEKDMRYGRKTLLDQGRITWTRADKGVTFFETDRFVIDYTEMHPEVFFQHDQQIKISKKVQERYDFYDGWWAPNGGEWRKVDKIGLKKKPETTWGMSNCHDHLYYPIQTGRDLKYAQDEARFDSAYWDDHGLIGQHIRYLSDFLKYPSIEVLEKSGFEQIVMDRARGAKSRGINIRAKDLRKILRCNGAEVKALRSRQANTGFLDDMWRVRTWAPWAKVEDVDEIAKMLNRFMPANKLELIKARTDTSKLLRRMLEYNRATGETFALTDYGDYLSAIIRMGGRTDKKALYPKDFVEAHDLALEKLSEIQDELDLKIFQENQLHITRMKNAYYSAGLLIRPAWSQQELRDESEALEHCVRTYAKKVCEGICAILFIRQAEKPDAPYFTLELSPTGKVVQCRGRRNRGYPEEVARFIDEWQAWRLQMIKGKDAAAPAV